MVTAGIDLDIDSDNNNGTFGGPNRDSKEDRWEAADENDKKEKLPGKFIPVNDGDADNDQIPGFADGFGKFGKNNNTAGGQFVKAILDLSTLTDKGIIIWDYARIKFTYSASKPKDEPLDNGNIICRRTA